MIEPGTLIDGRYEVLERVGSGGMADVYLASDRLLGRRVAVKVLHHRFAEDDEFVERFKREASSAAGLSHPNVVAIFDRGEWDGTFYIAMEYLPGRTLKELLRDRGLLAPATAIDVVLQVLRAARFAHRRGVIHRDLKPHNVILDEEGRAKVTDFGIARAGASDMTLTGSIMGTAQYLSPEQAQGQSVTESSDLYAVGVMLYELLVGKVPFEGETAVTIALQHISQQAVAPSLRNPAVPPALDAIVLRMLAKDPADRYADTSEAIAALEEVRAALPEPADEHVLATAPRSLALGNGVAEQATGDFGNAAAAAASAGVLAAYGAAGAPTGAEPPAEDPEQARRRRRRRTALLVGGLVLLVAIVAALLVLLLQPSKHTVPEVVGKARARASTILRHAGFRVLEETGASGTVPAGTVVSETPTGGSEAKRGSTVTIVVSTGQGYSLVPKVAGMTESEARARIHGVDLEPVLREESSETVRRGETIGTDPQAGKRVRHGGDVTLIVSSGPPKVKVPHLRGDSRTEAEAALEEVELAVGAVTSRREPGVAAETVISQSPGADSLLAKGSAVDLVVAKKAPPKPAKVFVPLLLRETQAKAEATLQKEGLVAKVLEQPVSEAEEVGRVIKQDPGSGSKVRTGSTVELFIGKLASTTSSSTSTTETADTTTSTTDTTTSEAPPGG